MKTTNKQKILQRAYNLNELKGQWFFSHKEDFSDMPKGSFRNASSELQREGRVKRIGYGKYTLTDCMPSKEYIEQLINHIHLLENNDSKILQGKNVTNIVTVLPQNNDNPDEPLHLNTINAIHTCLQAALWDDDNNIHNVNSTTLIPKLYKYLKSEGRTIDKFNYGIDISPAKPSNDLSLKARVYPNDIIEIFISNSSNPIMVNVQGIKRLRNKLEQFRIHLGQYTVNVPTLDHGFKVVKFDYARDGILPIPVSFTYNYYNFENELIQIYTKRSNSFFTETRFEKRDINPNAIFLDFEQRLLGSRK